MTGGSGIRNSATAAGPTSAFVVTPFYAIYFREIWEKLSLGWYFTYKLLAHGCAEAMLKNDNQDMDRLSGCFHGL